MPIDKLKYLGNRIHTARKACDLTQRELAEQTHVGEKTIQCIERAELNPPYEILFPIVNRLGLTANDLFNAEPDVNQEEINRFLGQFRTCNRTNQQILLNTLDFLAEQLLALQKRIPKNLIRACSHKSIHNESEINER